MIEGIPDYILLMTIAIAGTAYRQTAGWIHAKQKNPELEFDIAYLDATLLSMLGMALLFSGQSQVLTVQAAIVAFLSGYAGQKVTTGVASILPTPGTVDKGGVDNQK